MSLAISPSNKFSICWFLIEKFGKMCIALNMAQSAEYVKYAKIFGDYFWLIFIPTEDLGD